MPDTYIYIYIFHLFNSIYIYILKFHVHPVRQVLSLTPILRMKEQAREQLNSPRATKLATTGRHRKRGSVPPMPLTPHGDEEQSGDEKKPSCSLYEGGKRPTRPHGPTAMAAYALMVWGKPAEPAASRGEEAPRADGLVARERSRAQTESFERSSTVESGPTAEGQPSSSSPQVHPRARTQLLRTAACRGLGAPGGALAVCSLSLPRTPLLGGGRGRGRL